VTIGYEGRTLPDFVAVLASFDVSLLVDVRLNAISRKPGFSKKALAAGVVGAGIEYRHEPSLGNPIDNRAAFHAGEARARARYRKLISASPAVDELIGLARKQRVALMCVERDHAICHRDELVREMLVRAPRLKVTHAE
jgi:uncharacterized protein (DUF488 family)